MGKGLPVLIIATRRQDLVYLPAILILNAWFAFSGFIYAQAVTDVVLLVLSIAFFMDVILKFKKRSSLERIP